MFLYLINRTTSSAKDVPNMRILNFHMFCVSPLPGVFQNTLWARQEYVKIYSRRGFTWSSLGMTICLPIMTTLYSSDSLGNTLV